MKDTHRVENLPGKLYAFVAWAHSTPTP
jgi:hypothetical protein